MAKKRSFRRLKQNGSSQTADSFVTIIRKVRSKICISKTKKLGEGGSVADLGAEANQGTVSLKTKTGGELNRRSAQVKTIAPTNP